MLDVHRWRWSSLTSGTVCCETRGVHISVVRSTALAPSLSALQLDWGGWQLTDRWLLSTSLLDGQEQFRLKDDVGKVRLWVCCPIVLQTMADWLANVFYEHINQCALVLDIRDFAWFCDQIVCVLFRSHDGRLHVWQDGCVIFGGSLISCLFFVEVIHHFRVWAQ